MLLCASAMRERGAAHLFGPLWPRFDRLALLHRSHGSTCPHGRRRSAGGHNMPEGR